MKELIMRFRWFLSLSLSLPPSLSLLIHQQTQLDLLSLESWQSHIRELMSRIEKSRHDDSLEKNDLMNEAAKKSQK